MISEQTLDYIFISKLIITYDLYFLIIVLNQDIRQFDFEKFLKDFFRLFEYDHKVYPNYKILVMLYQFVQDSMNKLNNIILKTMFL